MRWFAHVGLMVTLMLGSNACRRRPPASTVPLAAAQEDEKDPGSLLAPASAPVIAQCVLEAPRFLVSATAAADASGLEGGDLAHTASGDWMAWLDRGASAQFIAPPTGSALREPIGAGESNAPLVAAMDAETAVLVSVLQRGNRRVHRVSTPRQGQLHELFTQVEPPDDGLSIAAVATSEGVLIAWDEERPRLGGAIVAQFISRAVIAAGASMREPPAARTLSLEDHDAASPTLVAMPDGSAILAWLAAEEIETESANQTAADIFVRKLTASGMPNGEPVRITPGPGNRFGITMLASAGALWVSYRVAGDADHESQGDGGAVAIVRLGADLHPTASPAYVTAHESVPSGEPTILADGAGVNVFWAERQGEGLRTMRRAVEANGAVTRPAQEEPRLAGELPAYGDAASAVTVVHGPHGEPGIARLRCPPIAALAALPSVPDH